MVSSFAVVFTSIKPYLNGKGDLVVMSQAHYERLHNLIERYRKLDEAESLDAAAEKGITHAELMKKVKARSNERGPYEIRYLPTAQGGLEEIFDYIVRDNPSAVAFMLEKFDDAISRLAGNPHLGVAPRDDRLRRLGYRMLAIWSYHWRLMRRLMERSSGQPQESVRNVGHAGFREF